MRGFFLFPAVLWLLLCASPVMADALSLLYVSDGDTIRVAREDGQQISVRLYGIDAPEGDQDGAHKAHEALTDLLHGRQLSLLAMTRDYRRRTVALVFADGVCVNADMIARGFAWVYTDYCKLDFCKEDWTKLEAAAREAKRGLWQAENPIPPWEWRRRKTPRPPDEQPEPSEYRGNVNSRVFHKDGCPHFDCQDCTRAFHHREDALEAKFKPCKICKP